MKRLGLLRHAKSDWDDIGQRDFDRGLNDRGRKGARLIGEHIAAHGVPFDLVLASPAERAGRPGHRLARELDVDDRADGLDDGAECL